MEAQNIAARLLQIRKQHNLTQAQLAERLQIRQQIVSYYEKGRQEPSAAMIIDLARAYEMSVKDLLGMTLEEYYSSIGGR